MCCGRVSRGAYVAARERLHWFTHACRSCARYLRLACTLLEASAPAPCRRPASTAKPTPHAPGATVRACGAMLAGGAVANGVRPRRAFPGSHTHLRHTLPGRSQALVSLPTTTRTDSTLGRPPSESRRGVDARWTAVACRAARTPDSPACARYNTSILLPLHASGTLATTSCQARRWRDGASSGASAAPVRA